MYYEDSRKRGIVNVLFRYYILILILACITTIVFLVYKVEPPQEKDYLNFLGIIITHINKYGPTLLFGIISSVSSFICFGLAIKQVRYYLEYADEEKLLFTVIKVSLSFILTVIAAIFLAIWFITFLAFLVLAIMIVIVLWLLK